VESNKFLKICSEVTRFRLVPKSTTLDDREGPLCALSKHASSGTHHENLNEDRPILSATKMQPVTLVSGSITA